MKYLENAQYKVWKSSNVLSISNSRSSYHNVRCLLRPNPLFQDQFDIKIFQSIKLAFVNDVTTIQSVNSDRELLDNFIKQQQQQQQIGFVLDSTGDVNSDDVNSNAKDFNSIPERNMWGNNNILDSTEWDGEEKSINNDGNMLTVETFMPSGTIILK
ncbi:unnamed protein product [Onchocerca flexuosa]|uniref:Uncharacterized protein n=1 Tax=Onchocerca flexuosa TaxID=387005 RepID=A0A3P8B1G5_9BILA|nr:unnamed protein product [Onchocerca flexuosa]